MIRIDVVEVQGVSDTYADMLLTNQRIIFLMRRSLTFADLFNWVFIIAERIRWGLSRQPSRYEIELTEIRRFWTWRPEFSGAPAIDAPNGCSFDLVRFVSKTWFRQHYEKESREQVRAHFQAVEAAWKAAIATN
jgi:hypothetical protein